MTAPTPEQADECACGHPWEHHDVNGCIGCWPECRVTPAEAAR